MRVQLAGRMILLHQCAKAAELLDGKYMMPDLTKQRLKNGDYVDAHTVKESLLKNDDIHLGYSTSSVVYGDTDSTYFVTHGEDDEEATLIADTVGERISASFPAFMRDTFLCSVDYDEFIITGREVVSDRGLFVDKKRYLLHIIDNEGEKCDKLKVMGVDTKKTTMPAHVSKKLNHFLERFLKGEDWDDDIL